MKEIVYLIVVVIFLYLYHNDDTEPWIDSKTIAMIVTFIIVVPIGVPIMLAASYWLK